MSLFLYDICIGQGHVYSTTIIVQEQLKLYRQLKVLKRTGKK